MAKEPIRRQRLYEQVTKALALRILGGNLSLNGSSLTEAELCADLGVSRTVLREAVKVLASKGLVEVRPKTGMRVRPRNQWNLIDSELMIWQAQLGVSKEFVRDLYQVRMMLEPATAAAAAMHATDEECHRIRTAIERMESEINDFAAYVEDDCQFHELISTATHNDFLIQINRILLDALRGSQTLFRTQHIESDQAVSLHREVAEAILRRDPDAAKSAMSRLIDLAEQNTLQVIKNVNDKN
jgi:GntR family transcriptional regulator, galactonate operon transcriptional repressor